MDSLDTPLADATIEAGVASRPLIGDPPEDVAATTGPRGRAVLTLPLPTRYVVRVGKTGYGSELCHSGPGQLRVVLHPTGALTVTTRDAKTRELIGGATLSFLSQGAPAYPFQVPDGGTLVAASVPPGSYSLAISHPDYLDYQVPRVEVPAAGTHEELEIALFRGLAIRGTVIDEVTGEPLSAGQLEYTMPPGDERTTANITADGAFELRGQGRPNGLARVLAPGYDMRPAQFDVSPQYDTVTGEQTRPALLRVSPAVTLSGRVTSDGGPVPGATLLMGCNGVLADAVGGASTAHRVSRTQSEVDGSFAIGVPNSPPASTTTGNWHLLAIAPGYAPELVHVTSVAAPPLRVHLVPGTRLSVRVTGVDGFPEPNATVYLALRSPYSVVDRGAVLELLHPGPLTDDRGFASASNLCRGLWDIQVRSANGSLSTSETIEVDAVPTQAVVLALDSSCVARGAVVDTDGIGVAGARVICAGETSVWEATTDDKGHFTLHLPGPGETTVAVLGRDLKTRSLFTVWGGGQFRFVVETHKPPPTLLCTIADAFTFRRVPLAEVILTYASPEADSRNERRSHARGGYHEVLVPPAASGTLAFHSPGYRPAVFSLQEIAARNELEVLLEPLGVQSGPQVLRVRLSGVLGMASVRAFDAGSRGQVASGVPITESEFSLEVGTAREVLIVAQSVEQCTSRPYVWRAGDPESLDIRLDTPGGRVKGRIRGPAAREASLTGPLGLTYPLDTDREGRFAVLALPPGEYRLQGTGEELGVLQIRAGETTVVDL